MQVGIPPANIPAANAFTLSGYAAGVAARAQKRRRNLVLANRAFQTALHSGPVDASSVQLHRTLATTLYKVLDKPAGMAGLGDDIDDYNEVLEGGYFNEPVEPPDQDSGSWWQDILKTFGGAVGLGVAGRIAGQNPWARPPVVAPAPEMPAFAKIALVGGGVLAGAYVLSKVIRK